MEEPSAPEQIAPRTRRELSRNLGLISLGVLVTLFAVLNLETVRIDWIVGSWRAPLIIVIVISLVIGMLLGRYGDRLLTRRRRG